MINDNNDNTEETLHRVKAMCQQEAHGYKTCDFLHQDDTTSPSSPPQCGPLNAMLLQDPIDVDCRTKMAAWCYQVVDFCKFNRETVAIAMNLLDRFVASPLAQAALTDRKTYQLAAMTALYTAVKIHEPEAMDPKLVSTLSRGTYLPHEVEAMEAQLLTALTWRVNPPTAMAFVRHYLDLIPSSHVLSDPFVRATLYDLTKFQTELAVAEYDFLQVPPSVVAFCSLMNSLESVGCVDTTTLESIATHLAQAIDLQGDVTEIQMWLYQAVVQEPAAQSVFASTVSAPKPAAVNNNNNNNKTCLQRQQSCEVSPRSIAAA